jgi:hypothetical protein
MILDDDNLPILDQFSEEGFVDCIFKLSDSTSDENFYYFNLFASHKGKKVGFAVRLVKNVGPGFDGDMNLIKDHVYHRGVIFQSLGQVSDDLITALAELYGQDTGGLRMVQEESFTLIALHNESTDLQLQEVRMKLFGRDSEPFVEDEYYESFFNVDLPNGFVSWNEKDADYRIPLIKALSTA